MIKHIRHTTSSTKEMGVSSIWKFYKTFIKLLVILDAWVLTALAFSKAVGGEIGGAGCETDRFMYYCILPHLLVDQRTKVCFSSEFTADPFSCRALL